MDEIVHEIWRPVAGWEGLYEVSSEGRVKSLARKDRLGRPVFERILKPLRGPDGYLQVNLCRDGSQVTARVHRLACEAFHGPAPEGRPHALHANHDPSDNRPENLRWGSQAENMQDKVDADRQLKGAANGSKLSEVDVRAIQSAVLAGATMKAVAAKYGLSRATVSEIARGKKWAHIANVELQVKLAKKKRRKTLADEEVLQAFDLAAQGLSQEQIGARLGVGRATIWRILGCTTPRYRALRAQRIATQQRTPAESCPMGQPGAKEVA